MQKPAKRNHRAIIVLGMHRSGTSALMRMVNLRGVDLGSNLMSPVPNNNEKGFWEHMDIFRMNEKLFEDLNSSWDDVRSLPEGWWESEAAQRYKLEIINILERDFTKSRFWGVKDPRICRFLPIWRPLLEQIGCKPYFLIIVRNPLEVVSSLAKRDGFSQGKSCLLWLKHIIESEKGTRNTSRLFVTYEELLSDWKGLMSRAQKSFQFKWPVTLKKAGPEIASFLQKSLRHNIVNDTVLIEDSTLSTWIKDLYFETKGAVNGDDSQLIKSVTAIEAELKDADCLYEPALADIWKRFQANHAMLQERSQQLNDIKIRLEGSIQDRGYHLSTIDKLQTTIKEKNERIQQLNSELTGLRHEFRSSQEAAAAREAQFAKLQFKAKEREERIQQLDTEVLELRDQLSTVQQTVVGRETEVTYLQTAIKEKNERIQQLNSELTGLRHEFTSSQKALSASEACISDLQYKVKERDGRIHDLDIELVGLREEFLTLRGTAHDFKDDITHLQADLEDRDDHIKHLNAESADLRKELTASQTVAAEYGSTVDQLQTEIKERDERLQQLYAELSGLREETAASQEALSARETEAKNLHIAIVEKDERIHKLDADVGRLQDEVDEMRTQVENCKLHLVAISGSKSWKLTSPLRWVYVKVRKIKGKIKTIRYLLNRQFPYHLSRQYRLINKSGLFDAAYYLKQNPDIAESGMNPLAHYLRFGAGEGRNPQALFDGTWYLSQNPSLAQADGNPLVNYIEKGAAEGVDPHPLFDTDWYLEQNPDVAESTINPLVHYLYYGATEGRDPNPLFDSSWYLEHYPNVKKLHLNPLVHYVRWGAKEGWNPGPRFDSTWYLEQNPDLVEAGVNPLVHYLYTGMAQGLPCCPPRGQKESWATPGKKIDEPEILSALQLVPDWKQDWNALLPPPTDTANRVLVVDWKPPTPDIDSGSYRMSKILACLVGAGLKVDFIGGREAEGAQYTAELEKIGIKVLVGREAAISHLLKHGMEYKAALLARPEIFEKYVSMVRAFAVNAKVLYDTVDLHWLRLARGAEVAGGDPELNAQSEFYKRLELANARSADVCVTITEEEKKILLAEQPDLNVRVLSNIHEVADHVPAFSDRRDLFFIGSFDHLPNIDAVHYFVSSILPLVTKEMPDIRFRIVGSKMPSDILELASANVEPLGYAEDVESYFQQCRVFVTPLRYGAGMKGKVGQSLSFGLPVVTTRIGAEGIGLIDGESALIGDNSTEFAAAVIRLYTDEALWSQLSKAGQELIKEKYSTNAVQKNILSLVE